jgi:hypothetical protein
MDPSSDQRSPVLRDCPKCGKLLVNSAPRREMDADGNPEIIDVYLCFAHGFYTFRASQGLKAGLTPWPGR